MKIDSRGWALLAWLLLAVIAGVLMTHLLA